MLLAWVQTPRADGSVSPPRPGSVASLSSARRTLALSAGPPAAQRWTAGGARLTPPQRRIRWALATRCFGSASRVFARPNCRPLWLFGPRRVASRRVARACLRSRRRARSASWSAYREDPAFGHIDVSSTFPPVLHARHRRASPALDAGRRRRDALRTRFITTWRSCVGSASSVGSPGGSSRTSVAFLAMEASRIFDISSTRSLKIGDVADDADSHRFALMGEGRAPDLFVECGRVSAEPDRFVGHRSLRAGVGR